MKNILIMMLAIIGTLAINAETYRITETSHGRTVQKPTQKKTEHWKAIAGYEGLYQVSDFGRVRILGKEKSMKPEILKPGRMWPSAKPYVRLFKDGKPMWISAPKLAAQAFGKKLEDFDSAYYTLPYLLRPVEQLDKQGNVLERFQSITEASIVTGIARQSIGACCLKKLKSAGGFMWRFAV